MGYGQLGWGNFGWGEGSSPHLPKIKCGQGIKCGTGWKLNALPTDNPKEGTNFLKDVLPSTLYIMEGL